METLSSEKRKKLHPVLIELAERYKDFKRHYCDGIYKEARADIDGLVRHLDQNSFVQFFDGLEGMLGMTGLYEKFPKCVDLLCYRYARKGLTIGAQGLHTCFRNGVQKGMIEVSIYFDYIKNALAAAVNAFVYTKKFINDK